LEVRQDFPDVVAEAPQRLDTVRRDDLGAPPDAGVAAANDAPVGHERTGDHRVLADADDLAHLGTALHDLHDLRLEQTVEGGFDVVSQLVDDVVEADI